MHFPKEGAEETMVVVSNEFCVELDVFDKFLGVEVIVSDGVGFIVIFGVVGDLVCIAEIGVAMVADNAVVGCG